MNRKERLGSIKLILSDVDGVFTDGGIILDDRGVETKRFSVQDGMGIKLWQQAGYRFGIVTARKSNVVLLRSQELKIDIVCQGASPKLVAVQQILEKENCQPHEVCYLGDDFPDIAVLGYVGAGFAVSNAASEVKEIADYVTVAEGGYGAVREVVREILVAQGRWNSVVELYR
ncbi:MAG: HAD hydrolase family protein [Pirellulaceae bacterium]|nr:HAD hydrolase family protein [Pirellulaceae bacterium]